MENTPQQQDENRSESFSETYHTHIGPLLGILVVVLVLIFGGMYLWGAMLSKESYQENSRMIPNNEPETPRAAADKQILNTLSPSTELDAIYADLESTNLDSLDADLDQVVNELNATP